MKKISLFLQLGLLSTMFFTGCVKDRNVGPDFSSTQPVLELRTPVSNIAGMANFARAVIAAQPDTLKFYVNLASANTLDRDVNVTIGVDDSKINDYNSDPNNTLQYERLPDSTYSLLSTGATIVAGQRIDSFNIVFFKDKIDPASNYMLPVVITDGDGILLSGNQDVIWFHAIGNCLAGNYHATGTRTLYNGAVSGGDIFLVVDLDQSQPLLPNDPETILTDYADLGSSGWQYVITVDCVTNTITDVGPNDVMAAGITPGSFKLTSATYDVATHTIHIVSQYTNTSGNDRVIDETFTKQ